MLAQVMPIFQSSTRADGSEGYTDYPALPD